MTRTNYRLKFYLNASHYVTFGDKVSDIHPHTWEIVTDVSIKEEAVIQFTELEKEITAYFKSLDGVILNDRQEFTDINPTLENIGDFFASRILMLLENRMWEMYKFEIYENPTRALLFEKPQLDQKLKHLDAFKERLDVLSQQVHKPVQEKARPKVEKETVEEESSSEPSLEAYKKHISYFKATAIVLLIATLGLAYFGIPEIKAFVLQYL